MKRMLYTLTMIAIFVIATHPSAIADIKKGLIAVWAFDEEKGSDVEDSIGNHHGKIENRKSKLGSSRQSRIKTIENHELPPPYSPILLLTKIRVVEASDFSREEETTCHLSLVTCDSYNGIVPI